IWSAGKRSATVSFLAFRQPALTAACSAQNQRSPLLSVFLGDRSWLRSTLKRRSANREEGLSGPYTRLEPILHASQMLTDAKTGKRVTSTSYSLKCRPTQRMF